MQIHVFTLGTLRCFADQAELTDLPGQRLRCAVLLYLALERDVTREAAASLLWPERDDERARHALSQKLYELRQLLGVAWLETEAEHVRVTSNLRVDAHEFEAAVKRGALEEALAGYKGHFLADFFIPESKSFESWVDHHRARFARMHRKARTERINECVVAGDLEGAIGHARRWVELEPQEDDAQHRLIELLAARGDRAEALRQYDSYERALQADELEPLDHTRDLIARVRQSRAAPERAAPPMPPVVKALLQPLARLGPRRAYLAAGLAALLIFGAVGWWQASHKKPRSTARSIAVLPFLNLSTEPEASRYLSDGIADELITALSQTDSLRVAARTSSFRFKDQKLSIATIADSLDVALVVEGSVRQEGNRLRISARLIDSEDGAQIWTESFDREDTDALAVQKEIADAIVNALQIKLLGQQRSRWVAGTTTNAQAHELYLRGRYLLHKGTRAPLASAIAYFDSAIARDAGFALAYANLAEAYVKAAAIRELPHGAALESARRAAHRSIQLAPTLADAHAALARVELERWNWSGAEREANLAIKIDPRNATAHATNARVLLVMGAVGEAVKEAELAARLEPLSPVLTNNYAEALRAARRYHDAARMHRIALELEPDLGRQSLAKVYLDLGMYDSALVQFDAAREAGAPHVGNIDLLWSAYTHARAGHRDEALSLLERFRDRQPRGPNAYMIAALYLATGQRDAALTLAENGVIDRNQPAWRQLPWDPIWDDVRADERFVQLLRQLKRSTD